MGKPKKKIHRTKALGIYSITLASLSLVLVTATLVVTLNKFLYNTICSVMGGETKYTISGDPSSVAQRFTSDYESKNDVLKAANDLNTEIVSEGIVLLKNEQNALPLPEGSKITVFGKNSVNPVLGGSGSNDGSSTESVGDVYECLTRSKFEVNPVMYDFYKSSASGSGRPSSSSITMGDKLTGFPTGETPISSYTTKQRDSYKSYNDAAIVFLSRFGGEGFDLPRSMYYDGSKYTNWGDYEKKLIPGANSVDDHYLQLDKNETDMIKEACDNFDKVIVVCNSGSAMELGFLQENDKIQAALWLGHPGNSGLNALGPVLKGEVNPSGRTVDTYSRDFTKDPSYLNFGNNMSSNGNQYYLNGAPKNAFFADYEEGIYVGYRYYETRGYTDGEDWYDENVVYPFGYGLSYSNFTYQIDEDSLSFKNGSTLSKDGEISITVNVTNSGDRDGKDVLQLYYTAPYIEGEIEKSQVVLGDFVKTPIIPKGETKPVTLTMKVQDMASYDYNDANKNGFATYELDPGDYQLSIRKNAHEVISTLNYKIDEEYIYGTSVTGHTVENRFDDVSNHITKYLSRADWEGTWPTRPTSQDREVTQEFINELNYSVNDKETDPWYSSTAPNQSKTQLTREQCKVKIYDLFGKDYDDPLWDELLDQLTVKEMTDLIATGNFRTIAMDNIKKPLTIDGDGPMGFAIFMGDDCIYDTCRYASEAVVAATWNKELAYRQGLMVGNEGLIGNEREDNTPYSGWYAPAVNIHRSPFGGRNFEYYSEDPVLSGKLATEVIKGAKEKGVYTYIKHFALNEQETNRDTSGLVVWANEQSMREIYFKPFECAVVEGKTTAMMSSFTRIGTTWAGGKYELLTEVLREEWGFKGMVITDFNLKAYMNADQMIRAGGDLNLSPSKAPTKTSSPTDITNIRRATKNILYTVANSNAMNGQDDSVIYGYRMPDWVVLLIVIDSIFLAATIALGGLWFFFKQQNKKLKLEAEQNETEKGEKETNEQS